MEENIKSLMLEDETFENIRQNFNTVLQRLFKNMIDSGSDEGSITLNLTSRSRKSISRISIRTSREKAA